MEIVNGGNFIGCFLCDLEHKYILRKEKKSYVRKDKRNLYRTGKRQRRR